MLKPKVVLLIFVSGKIVLTGAKVREEIYQAFEMIYPVLQGTCLQAVIYPLAMDALTSLRFPQGVKSLAGLLPAVFAFYIRLEIFHPISGCTNNNDCALYDSMTHKTPLAASASRSLSDMISCQGL